MEVNPENVSLIQVIVTQFLAEDLTQIFKAKGVRCG